MIRKGTWRGKQGYYKICGNGLAMFSYTNTMEACIYVNPLYITDSGR